MMEVAVKYHARKIDEFSKMDQMAFLCKDGNTRYLFLEHNNVVKQDDGSFLLKAKCELGSWGPQTISPDESPVLLYWSRRTSSGDATRRIAVQSIDITSDTWSVKIEGSVRLQYSLWCKQVCFDKHDLLDEESCMRLAFSEYIRFSYGHVPEASDDEIQERVARFWYAKAAETDEEE